MSAIAYPAAPACGPSTGVPSGLTSGAVEYTHWGLLLRSSRLFLEAAWHPTQTHRQQQPCVKWLACVKQEWDQAMAAQHCAHLLNNSRLREKNGTCRDFGTAACTGAALLQIVFTGRCMTRRATTLTKAQPHQNTTEQRPALTAAVNGQWLSILCSLDAFIVKDVQAHQAALALRTLTQHVALDFIARQHPVPYAQHCHVAIESIGWAEAAAGAVLVLWATRTVGPRQLLDSNLR